MKWLFSSVLVLALACQSSGGNDISGGDGGGGGGGSDGGGSGTGDGGTTVVTDAGPDATPALVECPETPPKASTSPPDSYTSACSWMDWDLSPDGFYVISQFGTTADDTTMGRNTSCGALQTHYAGQCCLFDIDSDECLDVDANGVQKQRKWIAPRGNGPDECLPANIPETGPPEIMAKTRTSDYWYGRRSIDWSYWTVVNDVRNFYEDANGDLLPADQTQDFPHPDYFYVAGAQRFGCDAYLRVSNPENGRCIVVYADDGGPGAKYEQANYAGRRILDSSPAVATFLDVAGSGWLSGSTLYVEWAKPGDYPGDQCVPCQSLAAKAGTEQHRSPFDLTQGFRNQSLCRSDNAGVGTGVHGGTEVILAP